MKQMEPTQKEKTEMNTGNEKKEQAQDNVRQLPNGKAATRTQTAQGPQPDPAAAAQQLQNQYQGIRQKLEDSFNLVNNIVRAHKATADEHDKLAGAMGDLKFVSEAFLKTKHSDLAAQLAALAPKQEDAKHLQ